MQIEVDGRTYVVRESDLTPRLVADLRRETGFAGWIGLSSEAQRGFDLDVLAALVWLARRIDGETVQYDAVLNEMSYEADVNISVEDKRAKAVEGGESPEA
jgi:hypothetical protein